MMFELPLSAVPKDTSSELAGLTKTFFYAERQAGLRMEKL